MTLLTNYLKQKIEFTPAVVGFLVKANQVLLGQRLKVSFNFGKDLISGIGGKIGDTLETKSESPAQALVREFQEEIKITPIVYDNLGQIQFIFPHKPKWSQAVQVYRISSWFGEPQETDVIKPLWFDQAHLPHDQMWADNRLWIPKILKGDSVNMIFLFDENNQVKDYQNLS